MSVRHMRLVMGLFFLCAAGALVGLSALAPDALRGFTPFRLALCVLLALVFAGLNLARWYAAHLARQQAATPIRRPLQRDPTSNDDEEPNPAFDFSKQTDKQ